MIFATIKLVFLIISETRTCKNGQHRLVHSLDLPLLQDVAREEGKHQQHYHNKQRPGAGDLLRARFGGICRPES